MITIAVDAMGGDHAPLPEVEGSVLAAQEYGVRVLLVGQPNVIRAELARLSGRRCGRDRSGERGDHDGRSSRAGLPSEER